MPDFLINIIVIEWLGIVFDWWQLPQHYHAKNMFDAELNWALGDFLSNNLFYKNTFLHITMVWCAVVNYKCFLK
jgi:hypothetical protein